MRRQLRLEAMSLLVLALPLVSLLFYRNAFPYFYVFLMPPALILCGFAFDELTHDSRLVRRGVPVAFVATLMIMISVALSVSARLSDGTTAQREVVRAVHEMFPKPVPYIDRNGMISSYPKVGFFMSTWGVESYRSAGRPVFANLLRTRGPKFLLVNSPALASVFSETNEDGLANASLLEDDVTVLREHFVPYWGPVYVTGKAMHLSKEVDTRWDVLVAGPYRLFSEGPVVIGGAAYAHGSIVELHQGSTSFSSNITQDVVLRTTSVASLPLYPPPKVPLYTGF
jgi:hypothetical protein